MGVEKGPNWSNKNIYIEFEYESVMFRWDYKQRKSYCKFYGETNADEFEVPHDQELYNQALQGGVEITKEVYDQGRPKNYGAV